MKLNFDSSFMGSTGDVGVVMILRDAQGQIVFSSCRSLQRCWSALEPELCACLEGMSLALDWSHVDVMVETDSAELAAMINSSSRDCSQLGHLVEQVKYLMRQGRRFSINKITREQNQQATC